MEVARSGSIIGTTAELCHLIVRHSPVKPLAYDRFRAAVVSLRAPCHCSTPTDGRRGREAVHVEGQATARSLADERAELPEDVARHLLELVVTRTSDADALDEDVLLDVTMGAVRCLLVRADDLSTSGAVALSPREREIARMVALGYTNKTIAQVLEISLWTVSTHLRRVFAKMGVTNRAAMVARLLGEARTSAPEGR
jgi:DNA-binding CsgD family transcriptional regulator